MKPLSIFKYLKGGLRKIMPLAVTVCLSVGLLYLLSMIVSHIVDQNVEMLVTPLSNMAILSGTSEKASQEQIAEDLKTLQSSKEIKGWYMTHMETVNLRTNSSNNDMFLFYMKGASIPEVMKWQKQTLLEGRLPKNDNEVLLHKKLASNYGLKLGSIVEKGTVGWHLDGDVKVVGIFGGPAIMGFSAINEELLQSGKVGISVITVTDDASVPAMNRFVQSSFGNRYEAVTLDRIKNEINTKNKNIRTIMSFVGVIVVVVLSVLLGNMCMIQYTQRSKEFELLHALGYTKKYIAVKVLKEIGISCLMGYAVGVIAAMGAGWLMNVYLLADKSLGMPILITANLFWVLLVPVFVTLAGMITPMKLLKFRDIT